jgi:hypothetical protein
MTIARNSHFSKFRIFGEWWEPDKPEKKYQGICFYSPDSGINLLLNYNSGYNSSKLCFNSKILLGTSTKFFNITLVDIIQESIEGHELNISANHLILGANYNSIEDIKFANLCVEYTYLNKWLNINTITGQTIIKGEINVKRTGFPTIFEINEKPLPKIEGINTNITFKTHEQLHSDNHSLKWELIPYIRFEPKNEEEKAPFMSWGLSAITELESLLSLLIGEAVYPEYIYVMDKDNLIRQHIITHLSNPEIKENLKIEDILIPYSELEKSSENEDLNVKAKTFKKCLIHWFNGNDDIRNFYTTFFTSFYFINNYPVSVFLQAFQNLEGFLNLTSEKSKKDTKKESGSPDKDTTAEHVEAFLKRIDKQALEKLINNEKEFPKVVSHTRNYWTHGAVRENQKPILVFMKIRKMAFQLEALIDLYILKNILFIKEEAYISRMSNVSRYYRVIQDNYKL